LKKEEELEQKGITEVGKIDKEIFIPKRWLNNE